MDIVRLTREVNGYLESRIYLKSREGYIPVIIPTGQTEEFSYDKEEKIGVITL